MDSLIILYLIISYFIVSPGRISFEATITFIRFSVSSLYAELNKNTAIDASIIKIPVHTRIVFIISLLFTILPPSINFHFLSFTRSFLEFHLFERKLLMDMLHFNAFLLEYVDKIITLINCILCSAYSGHIYST